MFELFEVSSSCLRTEDVGCFSPIVFFSFSCFSELKKFSIYVHVVIIGPMYSR